MNSGCFVVLKLYVHANILDEKELNLFGLGSPCMVVQMPEISSIFENFYQYIFSLSKECLEVLVRTAKS